MNFSGDLDIHNTCTSQVRVYTKRTGAKPDFASIVLTLTFTLTSNPNT